MVRSVRMPVFLAATVAVALLGAAVAAPVAGSTAGADQGTVTLTVSVANQAGDPVGDATVEATWDGGSNAQTTASNGKAFVDVPEGADVEIAVDHSTYVRNDPVVVEGASEREVEVDVHRRGSLRVRVTDGDGAVDDAGVVLRKRGRIAAHGRTDADGVFRSGTVERGEYSVSVVKRGYVRNETTVAVDGDVGTRVAIERGSVTYDVVVHDPHFDSPEPVSDATVAVEGVGSVTTQDAGRATIRVPVNAELDLEVTKPGYETRARTLDVGESDETIEASISRVPALTLTPVNDRMVAGETLLVSVTDEYGDPVEGAAVRLDGEVVGETDADGEFAVAIDEPGDHRLAASADGVDAEPVTVEAVRGDTPVPTETPTPQSDEATPDETADDSSGVRLPEDVPEEVPEVQTPGFTVAIALVALLGVALIARRR